VFEHLLKRCVLVPSFSRVWLFPLAFWPISGLNLFQAIAQFSEGRIEAITWDRNLWPNTARTISLAPPFHSKESTPK
jgi:hypothetical protein